MSEVIQVNVMAAPNRSAIVARVERAEGPQNPQDPHKWSMTVSVSDATPMEGGLFVRPGDVAEVFTTESDPGLHPGDEFRAEVEFIGGPTGGTLRLLELQSTPGDQAGGAPDGDPPEH